MKIINVTIQILILIIPWIILILINEQLDLLKNFDKIWCIRLYIFISFIYFEVKAGFLAFKFAKWFNSKLK